MSSEMVQMAAGASKLDRRSALLELLDDEMAPSYVPAPILRRRP